MTEPGKDTNTHLPAPQPPPPPDPAAPAWLIGNRYVIILALIFLFLLIIFLRSEPQPVPQATPPQTISQPSPPGHPEPAAPDTPEAVPQPEAQPEAVIPEAVKPAPPPEEKPVPLPGAQPSPAPEVHTTPAPELKSLGPAPAEGEKKSAIPDKLPLPARPPEKLVRGEAFTRALIKIIDDQVHQRLLGWRSNSIILGYMGLTDDVNNLQLGVLEVARRTTVVLNENMTRFATTEAYNPHINEAMNFLMVSPDKYWFPSASGKYKEAISDFYKYIDDLKNNRSRFYGRVDNLIALMTHFKDILGSCFHNLLKDTEADGKPVSWYTADDYFYFSQGVALGMSHILEGVSEDFAAELHKKNSHKLVENAIHALHTGSELSPWLITNAAKDGILANHRANLSTYIGEAEHLISTLQTVLATN